MKSIASTLSTRILKKMNHGQARYTEQDLEIAEFPFRLKQQMLIVRESRFNESVTEPESKWFDSESDNIKKAWQTYLRQAERELIIPQDEIQNVTESAMEQLLNAYCKPREYIIGILFGDASEQKKTDLKSLFEGTDEHHYLGYALLRYMDKKNLDSMTRERADELLLTIDQKVTENYTAADWGKLLKPVFELGGGTVPDSLIRLFFEEKQLHDMARKFDAAAEITLEDLTEKVSVDEHTDQEIEEGELNSAFLGANVSETEESHSEGLEAESAPEELTDVEESSEDTDENFSGSLFDTFIDPEEEGTEPEVANTGQEAEPEDDRGYGTFPGFISDKPGEEMVDEKEDESEDEPTLAGRFVFDEEEGEEATPSWIGEDESGDEEEATTPWIGEDEEEATIPWIGEDESEDEGETTLLWIGEDESGDEEEATTSWIGEDESGDEEETTLPWIGEDESEDEEEAITPWIGEDESEDEGDDQEEETSEIVRTDMYKPMEPEKEEAPFSDEETLSSLFNNEVLEEEEITDQEKNESAFFANEGRDDEPGKDILEEEGDDDSMPDTPMWKSFLEREDADEEPFYSAKDQQKTETPDDRTPQSSYLNLFDEQDPSAETESHPVRESDFDRLIVWLKRDEKRYLKKLFKNSRIAYEQALTDLMVFDDWKSASGYLEREIFVKNQIDLFSETAVDFTDKLHSFFMKQKS